VLTNNKIAASFNTILNLKYIFQYKCSHNFMTCLANNISLKTSHLPGNQGINIKETEEYIYQASDL